MVAFWMSLTATSKVKDGQFFVEVNASQIYFCERYLFSDYLWLWFFLKSTKTENLNSIVLRISLSAILTICNKFLYLIFQWREGHSRRVGVDGVRRGQGSQIRVPWSGQSSSSPDPERRETLGQVEGQETQGTCQGGQPANPHRVLLCLQQGTNLLFLKKNSFSSKQVVFKKSHDNCFFFVSKQLFCMGSV